ncbi:hypothetical protein [Streptomyces sp. GC420]|uniref:hypothetical protein n=1 Tax=Streptomyces sp. GC420 TaxID=2697568 RepID=UPI001414EBE7|nr:hypothetical protein [Streptomyces sp. GC420]NBM16879.1 hypothetical protein [Streptomyces sp. GC420]
MESGPAIFAGTAFALFGAGLLLWTGVRLRQGEPVAVGVRRPAVSAALATALGALSLFLGIWCLGRI